MMEKYSVVLRYNFMTWTYVSDGDTWRSDEAWHYDIDIR